MLQLPTRFCLEVSFCLALLQESVQLHPLVRSANPAVAIHSGSLVHTINENEVAAERCVAHFEGECVLGRAIPRTSPFETWKFSDNDHLGIPISLKDLNFSQTGQVSASILMNRLRSARAIDFECFAI